MDIKTNLLLVDDEEQIRGKLNLWLTNRGYNIFTAGDGAEAIQCLNSAYNEINIMITDLQMPMMDGMNLIKKCRHIKPDLGIIVITGHGDVDAYIETLNMGVFEFLNKPFELDALEIIIKKLTQELGDKG